MLLFVVENLRGVKLLVENDWLNVSYNLLTDDVFAKSSILIRNSCTWSKVEIIIIDVYSAST